ncbi:MAG: diguanylate cyclase [Burkholderiales bacterium]|nr:diguanylate cyclase [Burkholderiales bacterium]
MSIDHHAKFEELKASGLLPSPKGVALAVMQLAQDENATNSAMARTIKADPALTGRIVKAANTSQFGGRRPVASVPDALVVLGLNTVRQLALGFSLVSDYRSGKCAAFDYERFWSHSLVRALAMQTIATRVRAAAAEEMFLLGLLSRVGRLALVTVYPDEYGQLLRQAEGVRPSELLCLEQQHFATDSAELTVALLADWGLPKVLTEPALHHEDPARGNFAEGSRGYILAHALKLSGALAEVCLAPEAARPARMPEVFAQASCVGLDTDTLTGLADQVVRDWQEWGRLLEVQTRPVQSFAQIAQLAQQADATTAQSADSSGAQEDKLRVLVIDDDRSIVLLLDKLLTQAGYRVFMAHDGKEGLLRALECRPHLVVSDWLMPEMDGLQFCRALRNAKFGRGVYLVLLTGLEDEARLLEAFEAGVDDYVLKPVNPRMLLARLRAGERVVNLQSEVETDREEIRRFAAELATSNRRLQEAALLDSLTGIPNRRYAMDRIQQEWSAAERSARPLACMLIDVDHFKPINDTYGHDVGDMVLQRVAEVLKHTARAQDVICRIGGEEFLVVCPDTDAAAAAPCAERLRHAVGGLRIQIGNVCLHVTISVGVAAMDGSMRGPDSMIKASDQAVYAAKQAGRNRTCVYRPRAPGPAKDFAVSA